MDDIKLKLPSPKPDPFGIYIHFPFCIRKCPYCDFYSITDLTFMDTYITALVKEIESSTKDEIVFDTIHFGGGTPSLLRGRDIETIIDVLCRKFTMAPSPEITIEANPGTVYDKRLKDFKAAGVNRLTIGVQSFQQRSLQFLGRIHSVKDAVEALEKAKSAGFANIGMDLIYGLPDQSEKNWRDDLETAVQFEPTHISCYMLTLENGTGLYEDQRKGVFEMPPDRLIRTFYIAMVEFLANHGYEQYEISNFSGDKSKRSRHNLKYWSNVSYLGFGPAAHSFIEPMRWWNGKSVESYIKALLSGNPPPGGYETLSADQRLLETIYTGLRKTEGLSLTEIADDFGLDFLSTFSETIAYLKSMKLIDILHGRISLTMEGMLLHESVAREFDCGGVEDSD